MRPVTGLRLLPFEAVGGGMGPTHEPRRGSDHDLCEIDLEPKYDQLMELLTDTGTRVSSVPNGGQQP